MTLPFPAVLPPGFVVAGRFTIERPAGSGGMGSVFKAQDMLHGGKPVALKVLHSTGNPQLLQRFTREAELLAELHHPGIVAYVAHGVAEGHQPFLAMEWLEGESLAQRLERQPLELLQTRAMLWRLAEALAVAHQRGIVHRDIKPSNLFLRSGEIEDVVLLDFGIARHIVPSRLLTGDAALIGTPGYMAPEQVSSGPDITPGADIFALGCVLYECLTGQLPFKAPTLAAMLAKILFAKPPPLSSLRPGLSASWQWLVDGMLAKDPSGRLRDATSLQAALSVLEEGRPGDLPPPRVESLGFAGLPGTEQQLFSVLLATPAVRPAEAPTLGSSQETVQSPRLLEALRTELGAHGARVALLADSSFLATFLPEQGVATDQAALAARSALFVQERWPEARVVLATGRGLLSGGALVGEVMDRAGALQQVFVDAPSSPYPVLDELTAGLLGPGFLLAPARQGAFVLMGEQLSMDETRPLLGRPTPCVGRERELSMLELAFAACTEESSARALLVTAPAGMGKSRLRHEFLRRLERQAQPVLILQGRGDPMRAEAADGLLAQALRRLCGIQDGERLEVRKEKFVQRISRHLTAEQTRATTEFLGELCGLAAAFEDSPRLRAAKQDPALLKVQVARALVSFLRAECQRGPVLLVLEDLHWADALTVRLVDEALRELSECPLMVLALARPEAKDSFPGLWARCLSELSLGGLSKRSGAQLVHEVLGAELSKSVTDRIVGQAGGNALFLEELIRAVKEGRGESPPETVLAMLQARIQRLEPEARQVLLAASFFGRTFWSGGVRMLLGEAAAAAALERWLRALVEQEMIEAQSSSRFPAEEEFRFRHALLRDAAQELVPGSHKPPSHRLVGQWLEQAGEPDFLLLAEHFHLGQEQEHAAHFYTRAIEKQFGLEELPRVTRWLETAMSSGATGAMSVRLRMLRSQAAVWSGEFSLAAELSHALLSELKAGSPAWCFQVTVLLSASLLSSNGAAVVELSQRLLASEPEPDAVESYVDSLCLLATLAIFRGARQETRILLERAAQVSAAQVRSNASIRGILAWAEGFATYVLEARPWHAWQLLRQSSRDIDEVGLAHKQPTTWATEALALGALGDLAGAMEKLRATHVLIRPLKRLAQIQYTDIYMAQVLAESTEPAHREEARALALKWAETPGINQGLACVVLARVTEEPRQAEAFARKACEVSGALHHRLWAHACLSRTLLTQGQAAEARQAALLGVQEMEHVGDQILGAIGLYLALAEACFAEADAGAGASALRQALRCIETRAEDIPEPQARERFLRRVPENARALELARSLPKAV
jgi:serine/threonine protein kinase